MPTVTVSTASRAPSLVPLIMYRPPNSDATSVAVALPLASVVTVVFHASSDVESDPTGLLPP